MSAPEKIWIWEPALDDEITPIYKEMNAVMALSPNMIEYTRTDLSQAAVAAALEAAVAVVRNAYAVGTMADSDFESVSEDIATMITPAQHDALAAHIAAEVAKARAEDAAKYAVIVNWAAEVMDDTDPEDEDSYFCDNPRECAESIAFDTGRAAVIAALAQIGAKP